MRTSPFANGSSLSSSASIVTTDHGRWSVYCGGARKWVSAELHSEEKDDAVGEGGVWEYEVDVGELGSVRSVGEVRIAYGDERSYWTTRGRCGANSTRGERLRASMTVLLTEGDETQTRGRRRGFECLTRRRGRFTRAAARFFNLVSRSSTLDVVVHWRLCDEAFRSRVEVKRAALEKERDGSGESNAAETRSPNSRSEKGGKRDDAPGEGGSSMGERTKSENCRRNKQEPLYGREPCHLLLHGSHLLSISPLLA